MKKRWISLVLSALMIFSSCVTIVQARETDNLPNEGTYFYYDKLSGAEAATVADSAYKSAYALLNYLGILNDETMAADATASRGLAAQIFGGIKAGSINTAVSTPFSDVPLTNKYADGIYTAKQFGVAHGDEKGKFRPGVAVTPADAAEMAIYALGYDAAPEEYLKSATVEKLKRDLLKGIDGSDTLTNGELLLLAINTFEAPMFKYNSLVSDGDVLYPEGYLNQDKHTLLDEYEIDYISGVVTAVSGFSMFVSKDIDKNRVQINRKNYKTESTVPVALFGKTVCAYVDDNLVITAWEDVNNNDTISANASELNFISEREVEYINENGRTKSKKIASDAIAVYNMESGVALSQAFKEGLVAKAATVSLIDNNGDGKIEVVLLCDYDYRVVDSTSSSGYIYFKYDKDKIDVEDTLSMQLNGEEVDIADVSVGDVAMVMTTNRYGDVKHHIILSRNTIGGVLKSVSNEGDTMFFNIDGTEYEATDFYKNYFNETDTAPEELRPAIGDEAAFYLSADGFIVSSSAAGNDAWNYAYLMGAKRSVKGFDNITHIKLFDVAKLAVYTYNVDDEIELYTWPEEDDTYTVEGKAKPERVEEALVDESGYKTEMIAYKLDGDGKISSLATEYTGETGTQFFVSNYPIVKNYITGETGSSNWLYMYVLGTLYNTRKASAIRVAPFGATASERVDEVFYKKWDYTADTQLSSNNQTGDSVTIYNSDAASNAGILVYRPTFSADAGVSGLTVGGYADVILVHKKEEVLDDDGNEATRIYYPDSSRMASIDFSSEVEFSALKSADSTDYYGKPATPKDIGAGDIIQYETDNYGRVRYVRVLFKNDNRGPYRCQYGTDNVKTSTTKMFDSMIVLTWGEVTNKSGSSLVQNLSTTGNNEAEYDFPMFFNGTRNTVHTGGTKYYLYDSAAREASLISFDEIQKGDKVVVISDFNVSYRAYVYR